MLRLLKCERNINKFICNNENKEAETRSAKSTRLSTSEKPNNKLSKLIPDGTFFPLFELDISI